MGSKDPSVARLRMVLVGLVDHAEAQSSALFVPRPDGLHLVAQTDVDQQALNLAHSTWVRRRADLMAGVVQRLGTTVLWPLFDAAELVSLVYLDNAPHEFPDEEALAYGQNLVSRLRRMAPPSRVTNYMAAGLSLRDAVREAERDPIAIALDLHQGKVRPAARSLGMTRETLYRRAHRLDIDLSAFRRPKGKA